MSDLRGSPLPVRKTSHKRRDAPGSAAGGQRGSELLGSLDVAVGAGGQHVAHAHQFGFGEHVGQRGSGRIQIRIRLQPQGLAIDLLRLGEPVIVVEVETHGRIDPGVLAQRVRQQRIEIAFGREADRGFQRTRQRRAGLGRTSLRSASRPRPPRAGRRAAGRRESRSPAARRPRAESAAAAARRRRGWSAP